ncbi:hypothetical protein INR49_032868, partial [Caranx melampygus]
MPVNQQHNLEVTDKMFIENANRQHPRRHHELFLRCRPYRGELPTVAGFLLYPDTPSKMETTSQEAFCFRPFPQQDRAKGGHFTQRTQQESQSRHPTSSRQTGRGNSSSREQGENEHKGNYDQTRSKAVRDEQATVEMQSQYQKDFPPPSSSCRKRTPALPQPDNIGINPAFRIEFNTVQRETYPGWPIVNHSLSVSVPLLPVSRSLSVPLSPPASSTTTTTSTSLRGQADTEVNRFTERPVPTAEPQLSGLLLPSQSATESPGDPSFKSPLLLKIHEQFVLVHHQFVGVPPGPDHRPLLLVLNEGVSFGEACNDVPDQPELSDVSVLREHLVDFVLGRQRVQTGHKQSEHRVSDNTLVGLVAGSHSPPHRTVMGLHVYEVVTDLDLSLFHCAAASSVETGQNQNLVLCLVASSVEIGRSLMRPSLMAFYVEVTGQSLNHASSETSLSVVTDQSRGELFWEGRCLESHGELFWEGRCLESRVELFLEGRRLENHGELFLGGRCLESRGELFWEGRCLESHGELFWRGRCLESRGGSDSPGSDEIISVCLTEDIGQEADRGQN